MEVAEATFQEKKHISLDLLMYLKCIKTTNRDSHRDMKSLWARTYDSRIVFLTTRNDKGRLEISRDWLEEEIVREKKLISEAFPLSDETTWNHAARAIHGMIEEDISGA